MQTFTRYSAKRVLLLCLLIAVAAIVASYGCTTTKRHRSVNRSSVDSTGTSDTKGSQATTYDSTATTASSDTGTTESNTEYTDTGTIHTYYKEGQPVYSVKTYKVKGRATAKEKKAVGKVEQVQVKATTSRDTAAKTTGTVQRKEVQKEADKKAVRAFSGWWIVAIAALVLWWFLGRPSRNKQNA